MIPQDKKGGRRFSLLSHSIRYSHETTLLLQLGEESLVEGKWDRS
jgi:hypothetical protein